MSVIYKCIILYSNLARDLRSSEGLVLDGVKHLIKWRLPRKMMIVMDNHSPILYNIYGWWMFIFAHGCPWRLNPRFLDGWFQRRVQYKHVRLKIDWEHVQTILLGFSPSQWFFLYWSTCRCALGMPGFQTKPNGLNVEPNWSTLALKIYRKLIYLQAKFWEFLQILQTFPKKLISWVKRCLMITFTISYS